MKKNRLFMLGLVTVFVAVLSLTLVSSTLASYASNGTFNATGKIAKWDVMVNNNSFTSYNGNSPQAVEGFSIDLSTSITETDGSKEADVTTGKMAPGTQGSFVLKLDNNSDVTAAYEVVIGTVVVTPAETLDKAPTGLKFTVDTATANIEAGKYTDVTVSWVWEFGAPGADNNYQGTTITLPITVSFTQVD